MTMLFDRVPLRDARRTADGYLVADARVSRSGIQEYLGSEVGRPEMKIVRVLRPEDEVFARDAMMSYAHRPMTNDHPSEAVTSDNWKRYSVGQTGGDVVRDGEFVKVPMILMDSAAIKDYESGKRELSMGYDCEIVFEPGEYNGLRYDAIQRKMRMNHVALVDRARGGPELNIGDRRNPDEPDRADIGDHHMSDTKTRTILVDGLSVETTEAGAQAISKLQEQIAAKDKGMADADAAHAEALKAKDAEIAKRDATIDDLKGKVLTDAQLDAKVKERADLIALAKAVYDADYTGKSAEEIRKAAVAGKIGDAAIKDKSDAYIEGRFEILCEDAAKDDPVRKAVGNVQPITDASKAYDAMKAGLSNAWQNKETA